MQIPFFTLDRQHHTLRNELENVYSQVIEKGQFILGEEVEKFENQFASYIGVDHCISCANGTDALELILRGLGIEQKQEVVIPGNTWISVAEAVANAGGISRFADMDHSTLSLDCDQLDSLITENTFAVIFVHQYGNPKDLRSLKNTLSEKGIFLIEDCAHACGAEINGIKCGAMGDAAAFSFYPTKNLGCLGDGGAILMKDGVTNEVFSLIRNHGQESRDNHLLSGRNSRLDELQAAFLNTKITHLDDWNQKRKGNAKFYLENISNEFVELYNFENSIYHQFVITSEYRDQLASFLSNQGISTMIHYPKSILQLGLYNSSDSTPRSDDFCTTVLSLPIYPEITEKELEYIVSNINSFQPPFSHQP